MTRPTIKKRPPAPLTEQGRMILRSERRKLVAEQTALAEQLRTETMNKINSTYVPNGASTTYLRQTHHDPSEMAFQKLIVPRVTAVLSTEGVRATVNVKMNAARTSGWTDFANINVTMAKGIEADPRNASAVLRGILYHEGGHIRWTLALALLMKQYNEAIEGMAGRTPMTRTHCQEYHTAWNIAEDQRMEMKVVDDSPNKAMYFLPMVLDVVFGQYRKLDKLRERAAQGEDISDLEIEQAQELRANMYPYVAWRRYMPKDLRRQLRDLYTAKHGYKATREIEKSLTAYMRASDPIAMMDAVVAFHTALRGHATVDIDNHQDLLDWYFSLPEAMRPPVIDPLNMDDDDDGDDYGDGGGMPDGADDLPEDEAWTPQPKFDNMSELPGDVKEDAPSEEEEDFTPDADDMPIDPATEPDAPQGGEGLPFDSEDIERDDTGVADDDEDLGDTLERMLNEAIVTRDADPIIGSDERAFNYAMTTDVPGSKLLPLHSTAETNANIVSTAITLAERLEEAFHAVTVEASPSWREQQTRGVLNVSRYLTRQHGDREFFRDFDGGEGEKPGHNMALSVLLDYSGSMSGSEGELAATAYAMKKACERLEIPCTVLLWDDSARLLWDGNESAECVPVFEATGGTNPAIALGDICNHRYDRENHVILFMTDGEFSTPPGYLNNWRAEGTYFIGTYYKQGRGPSATELAALASKGFDITHGITELDQLVDLMEEALCESAKVPQR